MANPRNYFVGEKVRDFMKREKVATQEMVEDNRLAYEEEKSELTAEAVCDPIEYQTATVYVGPIVSAGDRLLFEITLDDGQPYQDEIESLGEETDGTMFFKSGTPYGWDGNTISFPVFNASKASVKVYRCSVFIKMIDSKFIPKDSFITILPVGTVFSEGYASSNERKMYVLNKGTYYVRPGLALNIPEPCVCFVQIDEYGPSLEITTIDYMAVKFVTIPFDADSASMNSGYEFPLIWFNLLERLQDLSKTALQHLWFQSPNGMPYKVSVDDDGKLITTPIE